LISVGLNTWASLGYLHQLGWEFVGGEQVPWPSSLARGPYGWGQIATFGITGLAIVVFAVALRDQLPHRRASAVAVALLALLGVALILAAFRVDKPMLSGGSPATWHGWVHAIAFLLIISTGCSHLSRWLSRCGVMLAGGRWLSLQWRLVRCSSSSWYCRGATPRSCWQSSPFSPGLRLSPHT
jgi:FtsH-binding integral membrane protein